MDTIKKHSGDKKELVGQIVHSKAIDLSVYIYSTFMCLHYVYISLTTLHTNRLSVPLKISS